MLRLDESTVIIELGGLLTLHVHVRVYLQAFVDVIAHEGSSIVGLSFDPETLTSLVEAYAERTLFQLKAFSELTLYPLNLRCLKYCNSFIYTFYFQ